MCVWVGVYVREGERWWINGFVFVYLWSTECVCVCMRAHTCMHACNPYCFCSLEVAVCAVVTRRDTRIVRERVADANMRQVGTVPMMFMYQGHTITLVKK